MRFVNYSRHVVSSRRQAPPYFSNAVDLPATSIEFNEETLLSVRVERQFVTENARANVKTFNLGREISGDITIAL